MLEELRRMSEKERMLWVASVKVKELNAILKEQGIKGYSKMKKAEKLEMVIDMILEEADEVEVITQHHNGVEIIDYPINSKDELEEYIDNKLEEVDELPLEAIKKNLIGELQKDCQFDAEFANGFGKVFGITSKSNKEILDKNINRLHNKYETKMKKIEDMLISIEKANEINDMLTIAGIDCKVKYDISYNKERNKIRFEQCIVGKSVLHDMGWVDVVIPSLNYYSGATEDYTTQDCLELCKEELGEDFGGFDLILMNEEGRLTTLKSKFDLGIDTKGNTLINIQMKNRKMFKSSMPFNDMLEYSNGDSVYYTIDVEDYYKILDENYNKETIHINEEGLEYLHNYLLDTMRMVNIITSQGVKLLD